MDHALPDTSRERPGQAGTYDQKVGAGRAPARTGLFASSANKKTIEGDSHADRDQQFEHLNTLCKQFEQKQAPAISVDCKKKELLGTFKHQGREWQPKGQQTQVNVYDYRSLANGKAIPYGVYDLVHNQGFGSARH